MNGVTYYDGSPSAGGTLLGSSIINTTNIYYLLLEDDLGCTSEVEFSLQVIPQPDITVDPPAAICQGELFTLFDLTINDANNANGDITFHTATPATEQNKIPDGDLLYPTATTTIYVLSQKEGLCSDEAMVEIQVENPLTCLNAPTLSIDNVLCEYFLDMADILDMPCQNASYFISITNTTTNATLNESMPVFLTSDFIGTNNYMISHGGGVNCSGTFILEDSTNDCDCPGTEVTFLTQSQINDFPSMYPNCTEIQGNLSITDSGTDPITDLNPLSQITAVGMNFSILNNLSLTNLYGLENIQVNQHLVIDGNEFLDDIYALENTSFADLSITNNILLLSLIHI